MALENLPVVVQPKVVVSPHPLSASVGRKLFYAEFGDEETLFEYMHRLNIYPSNPENYLLAINGAAHPVTHSKSYYPKAGDTILIRASVHGGGGEGGSDPVRVGLAIAILVASQGSASVVVGSLLGTSAAVGGAIIAISGMLLLNALIPVKVPSFDDSQPSPTYSLAGSANRARLFEPLPLVFGTVRMFPDHGAKPFTSFSDKDQLMIQVFNFGLSDVTLSTLKIGDAPLSTFSDVITEESTGFTGVLNNFPTNVDSIIGGDLVAVAGTYITKTSSINTTRLAVDISGLSYFVGREEGLTEARLTLIMEYRAVGDTTWLPLFGSTAEFDLVNGDKEAIRRTYDRVVSPNQYEVRVQLKDLADVVYHRTECDDEGENCTEVTTYSGRGLNGGGMVQTISFDQLRSFQPDTSDYTGQKRFALSIKASGQLNGRVDAFNAVVSAKVLVWTGSAFVNQTSSNPAWQFLSLARGKFDGTRRIYGAGLPDSRIDIETIKLWGAWCDSKGLQCNVVFDGKMTVIDMLNTIARCGRAVSTWSNGSLGVVYDEANRPVTAAFGMSNIVFNSFKVNYITENKVDEVIVAFSNPVLGYQRDTVRATVPGVVNPVNSVTIELKGVTDKAQAGKEANLIAAEQLYRRRIITWESDMEGLAVQRGDVAVLSHDLTQWDYSGRLISGTATTLQLDRDVPFTPATQHYIGVRYPNGTYTTHPVDLQVGEQSVVTLTTPLSSSPDADVDNMPQDYMWFFAPTATPGKLVKITDIKPLNEDRVRIIATDEEDAYYLAESNNYVYVTPGSYIGSLPTVKNLALGESLVIIGSGFGSKVNVSWDAVGEYGGAFLRAKDQDTPWKDIGQTLDKTFSFEWKTGKTVQVEVVTYNQQFRSTAASRATASLLLVGKKKRPADVANFVALQNGESVVFRWSSPSDIDLAGTELRYGKRGGSTWEDATPLTEVTKGTNITSMDVVDGDWTFYAKHRDTSLNYSANAVTSDVLFSSDKDIVDQVEQSPDWLGTLTNFIVHYTGALVPLSQDADSLQGGNTDWAADNVFGVFVNNPFPICVYEAPEIDIGFDDTVRVWGDIQSFLGPLETGVANPALSIDYRTEAGAYDGFEGWSLGNALLRYVKHKLTLDTSIGVAYIAGFNPTVDLKEHTDKEQFTISAGGSVVTFARPFHRAPFGSADGVSVLSGTLAYATITNITTTTALINVYNTSGTSAGGEAVATLTGV